MMRYAVVIEKGPTSYGDYVPDLPGCVAVGKSAAEVKRLIAEAFRRIWRASVKTVCRFPIRKPNANTSRSVDMISPLPTQRFQFSLRALLVALTLLGVWLGIAVAPAQRQRRAVKAIEALGGSVRYDWQSKEGSSDPSPNGPTWLRRLVGDDYFQSVECVYLFGSADETVKTIPHLKRLKGLNTLVFGMHSDQSSLREVEQALPQCEFVGVGP